MGGYNASVGELFAISFFVEEICKAYIDFNLLSPSKAKGVLTLYDRDDTATPLAEVSAESENINPLRIAFDAKGGHSYVIKVTSSMASYILVDKLNIKTNGLLLFKTVVSDLIGENYGCYAN